MPGAGFFPSHVPADSIRIVLKDNDENKLLVNGLVNLFVTDGEDKFILEKKTDGAGRLSIPKNIFGDSAVIGFFPKGKNKLDHVLTPLYERPVLFIDSAAVDGAIVLYQSMLHQQSGVDTAIASEYRKVKAKMMEEVILKSKRRPRTKLEMVEETYASGMFTSNVHNIAKFDLINDYQGTASGDVSSFLSGRIARDSYLAYLNENLVDMSMINSIPLSEVAFISVMGGNFNTIAAKGRSIIVYTKKGLMPGEIREGLKRNNLKVIGFAADKDYYNPVFNNTMMDNKFRTTLYWSSNTVMKAADTLILKLPAKPSGPIELSIMGFDENGEFISIKKLLNVQ